jgi:hypothetical protein
MTDMAAKPVRSPTARRFEYLGWALFLIGAGCVALFGADDQHGLYALLAGAAMALYVVAGWLMKFRVTGGLVFLAAVFLAYGAAEYWDLNVRLFPILLIAGGVVLVLKAVRGDKH